MEQLKKSWETPQLIILARGTPQETVLEHCKQQSIITNGKEANDQGCGWNGNSCAACQARPPNLS